jgi:hypothetical protein
MSTTFPSTSLVQQTNQRFAYNGESNLDLVYAMGIVGKTQPIALYQVGDLQIGMSSLPFFSCMHTAPLTEGMTPRLTACILIPLDTVMHKHISISYGTTRQTSPDDMRPGSALSMASSG